MSRSSESLRIRRTPEQDRSKATLQAIHSAAASLFGSRGTEAVSMTAIADAAGMTKAALYRYFDNKQALIYAMASDMFKQNRQRLIDTLSENPTSARGKLKEALQEYCELHREEPFRIRLFCALHTDPEISQLEISESKKNAEIWADYILKTQPHLEKKKLRRHLFLMMELVDGLTRVVLASSKSESKLLVSDFVDSFLEGVVD
ncbi:TetR/AcrR family transcriptional regulator [Pseudoteredinibacter isoporae]|uniref:AcrR family transcriptional regulator n=1 Tax=Pseudoteredinibacter isoporae TaxID=570281 RepID=A0A7X0JRS7_9GAMM|nr:TetR/AcrR family transcriptional regulator [Pseudoteredinibacter isoporae]MBB6521113.1 AcrR family transcriptional regulator [Pseudoteredinibacter isoporae]NHO86676.1 TetR/AcrR family transcriptional regulator [Pseudoteredinibacter isoporae]NIB24872.1 TetR/AcrR family transcriptional regulator [Pseudoteredinibacter isoporae]